MESSDEELGITGGSKYVQAVHEGESSGDDGAAEESKEPVVRKTPMYSRSIREISNNKKPEKGEIEVDFQYVVPSEAYYHSIKALLALYIDGEEAEEHDFMGMADHICERASIGQVVVSPLDDDKDPEQLPEFEDLEDEEWRKRSIRYYAERTVFAFSSILSLNWNTFRGNKKPLPYLKSI